MASKIGVTIPDALEEALVEVQKQTQAPLSAIVRTAIEEYLVNNYQKHVDADMSWGGKRKRRNEAKKSTTLLPDARKLAV